MPLSRRTAFALKLPEKQIAVNISKTATNRSLLLTSLSFETESNTPGILCHFCFVINNQLISYCTFALFCLHLRHLKLKVTHLVFCIIFRSIAYLAFCLSFINIVIFFAINCDEIKFYQLSWSFQVF